MPPVYSRTIGMGACIARPVGCLAEPAVWPLVSVLPLLSLEAAFCWHSRA